MTGQRRVTRLAVLLACAAALLGTDGGVFVAGVFDGPLCGSTARWVCPAFRPGGFSIAPFSSVGRPFLNKFNPYVATGRKRTQTVLLAKSRRRNSRPMASGKDPAKALTVDIKGCKSPHAVLDLLEQDLHSPYFNEIHASAAMVRLAQTADQIDGSVRENPTLAALLGWISGEVKEGHLEERSISNIFWAVAKMSDCAPSVHGLVPGLLRLVDFKVNYMNSRDVANVLWAIAGLGLNASMTAKVMPLLVDTTIKEAYDMNAQDFSNTIWAAATLKDEARELHDVDFVAVLVEVAEREAPRMTAQEVANTLWAAATLKQEAPELYSAKLVRALVAAGVSQAPRMNAQEVANTLWAAATLKQEAPELHSAKLVRALVAAGVSQAPRMNAQEVANTLWAAATLKQEASELHSGRLLVALTEAAQREACLMNDIGTNTVNFAIERLQQLYPDLATPQAKALRDISSAVRGARGRRKTR